MGVRGVWQPQAEALLVFDFKVIDTDAPYPTVIVHHAESVLESGAQDTKRMYKQAVEDLRGTFTPFVTSVDGLLHREAEQNVTLTLRRASVILQTRLKTLNRVCSYACVWGCVLISERRRIDLHFEFLRRGKGNLSRKYGRTVCPDPTLRGCGWITSRISFPHLCLSQFQDSM